MIALENHATMAPALVHATIRPSVFREGLDLVTLPVGATIAEILAESSIPEPTREYARVWLDGVEVPSEWFQNVRPRPCAVVSIAGYPAGSKGGGGLIPSSTARLMFSLLTTVAGAFVPGLLGLSGAALYATQAGISIAGVLLTNALIPPPINGEEDTGYSVSGTRNEVKPWGTIPKTFGRVRYFPPFAAVPATDVVGNDQFVNLLLCLGYGPLRISEPRIGSTKVADMVGVDYKELPGEAADTAIDHYLTDVYEETFAVSEEPMKQAPYWGLYEKVAEDGSSTFTEWYVSGSVWVPHENVVYHETVSDTCRFVMDLTFPQGLVRRQDDKDNPWKVNMHVQFRMASSDRWVGSANEHWLDLVPSPEVLVRNRVEEFPDTLDRISEWLGAIEPRISDLYDLLAYSLAHDERLTQTERLAALVATLDNAVSVLGVLTGEDEAQQGTLLAVLATVHELVTFIRDHTSEGEQTDLISEWLDEASQYSEALASFIEINRILSLGYGTPEDDARITTAWIRAMIFKQGLQGIFASPAIGGFTVVDMRSGIVRFGIESPGRYKPPGARYQIRARRTSDDTDMDTISDKVWWTSLRSYKMTGTKPFNVPAGTTVALAELRLKASEQVSGVLDQFSCILEAKLPAWDPNAGEAGEWTAPSIENGYNPAWCFADVLRGSASKKPVADSRLDLDNLVDWAAFCTLNGYRCDVVVDEATTALDLLKKIAACGRATFTTRNGKFGVVIDRVQDAPVQVFTSRNCRNFTASRPYRTLPHALKVRYVNPDAEWQKDETFIYAWGYNADGSAGKIAASVYEDIELWGVVDSPDKENSVYHTGLVAKHARYALEQIALRPEVFEFETDAEGPLLAMRGSRVKVQHDVIKVGLGSGRIVATGSDPVVAGQHEWIDVDFPVVMESGKAYACRVRRMSGSIAEIPVQTVESGIQDGVTSFTFASVFVDGSDPIAAGDLVWYGEADKVDFDCIVKEVRPDQNYGARLTCVPYNEALYDVDTEPTPDYDPGITQPPDINLAEPPIPIILSIRSDESVLVRLQDGTLQTRILVSFAPPSMSLPRGHYIQYVQAQFRPVLDMVEEADPDTALTVRDQSWTSISNAVDRAALEVAIHPVADGSYYEFRVRYITNHNVSGGWVTCPSHYVIGKTTPPPNVEVLLFEGSRLRWYYPSPPLDLAGFLVRFCNGVGATWDTATPAHDGIVTASYFDFNALGGGTITFMVRAIDVARNQSEREAVAIKNLGDPALGLIVFTEDHKVLEWPGEKTACERDVVTGDLAATEAAELFWQEGGLPFWGSSEATFWNSQYDAMEYIYDFTPDPDMLPSSIKLEIAVEGTAYFVEYLQDTGVDLWPELMGDNLWPVSMDYDFWPAGSAYQAWPGEIRAEAQTYRFRVRVSGGAAQGRITKFKIHLDIDVKHESVNDLIVEDTGSRAPLNTIFTVIVSVQVSIQQDTTTYPLARTVEVGDKDEDLGPLIYVYDASHTAVAGVVDVDVWGY